jgi:hypothetical protein
MTRRITECAVALLLALALLPVLAADSVATVLDTLVESHQKAAASQARIDKLDDDMRRMRDEMRQGVLQLEGLKADLPAIEQDAARQAQRRGQLERELSAGVPGQLEVMPSLEQMVGWLDQFIQADAPFMLEQRRQRLAGLGKLLQSEGLSEGDKFRAVLEVTQVELQYGRTVEAYAGTLRFAGKDEPVEFLRVGRLMLYYVDATGQRQGYWDRKTGRWQPLPDSERDRIHTAMQMVKGEVDPQLMELLLPAPERKS